MVDLRAGLDAQRSAVRAGAPGYKQRNAALRKLERALLANKDAIVRAISEDFRRPSRGRNCRVRSLPGAQRDSLRDQPPQRMDGAGGRASRLAILAGGRAGDVPAAGRGGRAAAWNYPLYLSLAPAVGAIAAGNHVMLKPSELAPNCAELMRALIADLFPAAYFTVVTGDAELAGRFSALPFDHLLFTGSARVGKQVMRAASENLTPVTLELGGKSPALVHRDYPIARRAERIMAGKLYNAGQTCVAPDYVMVAEDRLEGFINAARAATARMYPRLANNPDYTRIIKRGPVSPFARSGGASHECRRTRHRDQSRERVLHGRESRIRSALLSGVSPGAAIMQEEIFGPCCPS